MAGEKYFDEIERINKIVFKIIPIHNEENLPQISEMWEQVRILIDDKDIINQIGFDNDFHWGIESSCFLFQKEDFLKGKLLIGICGCTTEGCDDIVVDIDNEGNYIFWKIYHDRKHDKNAFFVFDKNDYEKALEEGLNNITKNAKTMYNWVHLLHYSKKELENENNKNKPL